MTIKWMIRYAVLELATAVFPTRRLLWRREVYDLMREDEEVREIGIQEP